MTRQPECAILSSLVVLRFTWIGVTTPSVPHSTTEAEDHHQISTMPGSTSSIVVPDINIEDIATILILYNDLMGRTLTANGSQYGVG